MQVKAIILGADKGGNKIDKTPTIFKSICGVPLIRLLINTIQKVGVSDISVVVATQTKEAQHIISPHKIVCQSVQLGTGHAVLSAHQALSSFDGCVLILFGDTPLIKERTLRRMIEKYEQGADVVALGFIPADTRRYGRMIMGPSGLEKIVEYKDATDIERTIRLCNSGVLCINGKHILNLVKGIKNDNNTGEYYITQVVELAKKAGLTTDIVMSSAEELHGINSPEELEAAQELFLQSQLKDKKND